MHEFLEFALGVFFLAVAALVLLFIFTVLKDGKWLE